jgi:thioredoxin 1
MAKPVPVEDATFDRMVIKAARPVLVDFWATWCKPCQMIAPVLDELAQEYDGKVDFLKLDVDHNQQTAAKYNVMSIPTIMVFKGGQPVSHTVGFSSKANVKRSLEDALG